MRQAAEDLAVRRAAARLLAILWACAACWEARRGRPRSTPTSSRLDECTFSSQRPESLLQHPTRAIGSCSRGKEDGDDVRVQSRSSTRREQITFVTEEGESLTVTTRVVEERHG